MLNCIRITLLLSIFLITTGLIGCSKVGDSPVANVEIGDASTPVGESNSFHKLWGIWNIQFDGNHVSIAIEPVRDAHAHFDITDMLLPPACDDCITIEVISFDPATRILDMDVTLRNPYQISGYDIRGILYTNDYGHKLLNADDWTKLWEIPGGMQLNPFKAFAKETPYRIFAAGAEHAEKYLLYVPDPPNYWALTFAVDVSFPDNCNEPYEIKNFWQEEIFDTSVISGYIYVDVRDWQEDITEVTLVAPEITGEPFSQFTHLCGDTWSLHLSNNAGAPAGDYEAKIIATSSSSVDLDLYDFVNIHISSYGVPDNPVDITPSKLKYIMAIDVEICGGYLYVTQNQNYKGVKIIDIDPPESAYIYNSVHLPSAVRLAALGEYVYVVGGLTDDGEHYYSNLYMLEIETPGSAHLVNTIDHLELAADMVASGGYVYIGDHDGVTIVDVDPVDSSYVIKTVQYLGFLVFDVAVSGGYGFCAVFNGGGYPTPLNIIDIDPPENAYIVNMVEIGKDQYGVAVSEGYAYLTTIDFSSGKKAALQIIDVNQIDTAHHVKTVDITGESAGDVVLSGGYAYVTGGYEGFHIIDIDPIETAHVVTSIDTPGYARNVAVLDGYAYVADWDGGVRIIKLW